MSSIIRQQIVNTRRKRIEPVGCYTTVDVCKLLTDAYAVFAYRDAGDPSSCCRHDEVIVLRDAKGHPDLNKVIAVVLGTEGSTSDCQWRLDPAGGGSLLSGS